ncbi:MAG: O-antigen ligase family protein [Bacteroidota bacterium]
MPMKTAPPTPGIIRVRILFLSLLVLGTSLVFSQQVIDPTLMPRLTWGMVALGLCAALLWWQRRELVFPPLDFYSGALLLYLFWSWASLLWATTRSEAVVEGQRSFFFVGTFYLSYLLLANDRDFIPWLLRTSTVLSVVALGAAAVQLWGLDWSAPEALYAVKGTAGHRNLFGTLLFLLLGFQLLARGRLRGGERNLSLVLTGALLLLILLLQVRSVWLATLSALLLGTVLLVRQRWGAASFAWRPVLFLPLGALLVVGLWYARLGQWDTFRDRLDIRQYAQSETAVERLRLWKKTWCTFSRQPWLGVGAGNWQTHYADCSVYGLYSVELNDVTYQRPHNDLLWVASELGILGSSLYLLILLAPLWMCVRSSRAGPQPGPAYGRLLVWLGLVIISQFSFPKERPELLLWMALLAAWIYWDWKRRTADATFSTSRHYFLLGALVLSALLMGGAATQRLRGEAAMLEVYRYKSEGNWPALIRAADRAHSSLYTLDPNAIPVHWYRGIGHFAQGQYATAQADYERALSVAPYSQHCWNDLGSCLEKLGQRPAARQAYQEALRISPLFDDPKVNLAVLGYKDQDYYNALYWLDQMRDSLRAEPYREVIEAALRESQRGDH